MTWLISFVHIIKQSICYRKVLGNTEYFNWAGGKKIPFPSWIMRTVLIFDANEGSFIFQKCHKMFCVVWW